MSYVVRKAWTAILFACCLVLLIPSPSTALTLRRRQQEVARPSIMETVAPVHVSAEVNAPVVEPIDDGSFSWEPLESIVTPSPSPSRGSQSTHDQELALSVKQPLADSGSQNAASSASATAHAAPATHPSISGGPFLIGAVGVMCIGLAAFTVQQRKEASSP
jgi:hypothetical protein